jgi:hypothetical protein
MNYCNSKDFYFEIKMKKIINKLGLTSIAFLIPQLMLLFVLHILDLSYFEAEVWLRWDSAHYLAIAKDGYELFPCAGKFGYPINATEMCGNAGWFPGYPFLIKLFSYIITDPTFVGGLLSKTFYFLSILMIVFIVNN